MKRYAIHLKVDYYESQKKEKKQDVEIGKKSNVNAAKKVFALALEPYFKSKDIVLIDEEYTGPTFSTAVLVNIQESKLQEMLEVLRSIDVVDIMEPDYNL